MVRYDRNDMVKVQMDIQGGFMSNMYKLLCPYVRMVRPYDGDHPNAMVYVTLLGLETGRIHPNFAMNLCLDGSQLERAAYAD